MIITKFKDEQDWLDGRNGKITGTKLKEILVKRGSKPKIGFYRIIKERVAIPFEGDYMARGKELESEALERYQKETGNKLITDLVMWTREDEPSIAFSPDGYTKDEKIVVDAKCLSSERHIEALVTGEIPTDLHDQVVQAFCVNDKLQEFHMVFYDPLIPKDYFVLKATRAELRDEIVKDLEYQREMLKRVEEIVKNITLL